ncbi:anti-sigma factor family protein [Thermomonospora umbrina]|uniref:Putative zinc finger protein n=1 Tax=Thermomonospora umbrina TaxID=111806 RepID=A0A3D9SSG7_9ACTN|nr:zf-HC2 domain-containing protein [Thermomonospora umbrina]REE95905.1 putative zinc finger protein [Thermomonospora umbrina]
MTCLGERLTALVDDELDHDERDRALAHLAGCRTCREEADTLRRLKSRLRGLSTPPRPAAPDVPDADFLKRLVALGEPPGSSEKSESSERFGGPRPPGPGVPEWREPSGAPRRRPGAAVAPPPGRRPLGPARPLTPRPYDNRPSPRAGAAMAARRRIPRRYLAAGAAAMVLGLGTTSYVAGGRADQGPSVVPAFDRMEAEHALTNGVIPLTETSPVPARP